jgi:hypothetical protein
LRLLPADRYLIQELRNAGVEISEQDYFAFRTEVRSRVKIEPGKPQAGFDPITAIILVVVGVGLQIAASFLKPQQRTGGRSGSVKTNQVAGQDLTSNQRFAPRVGFDSAQDPATLGLTIPAIYARKQNLGAQGDPARPAGSYGGIRVNTELIWSQMLSLGGSQALRAIFMIGESCIDSLDSNGFAIGNNSLGSYYLSESALGSSGRYTIYFAPGGGRINLTRYIKGRNPLSDFGNAEIDGGLDVYDVRGLGNQYRQDFCYTSKPSI